MLILSLVGTLVPTSAVVAQDRGGVGIKLVEVPAERRDDPRARVHIIDHLVPGASIERDLEVVNTTAAPLTVDIYPTGARIEDGAFIGGERGAQDELAAWIRLEPDRVTLDAGASERVTATIRVPADAEDGERYGVIWAQPPAGGSDGQQVVNRIGVRVYLSVGTGGEPALDFQVDSLQAARTDAGVPVVHAQVHNTGGRALELSGELQLDDGPGGLRAGPFPAELGTTLAIGGRGDVEVRLDPSLPEGPWHAVLTLRSGLLERSAEATITFPTGSGTRAVPVEASPVEQQRRVLLPLASILLLVAVLAVFFVLFARRRRRDEEDEEHQPQQQLVPGGR